MNNTIQRCRSVVVILLTFITVVMAGCAPNVSPGADATPRSAGVTVSAPTHTVTAAPAPATATQVASATVRPTSTRLISPSATATAVEPPTATPTATAEPTFTAVPEFVDSAFGISVPSGVSIELFAENLSYPTALAYDDDGNLYVGINNAIYPTQPVGEIFRLRDTDNDGRADETIRFTAGLDRPVGLLYFEGELYVAQRGSIVAMRDSNGDGEADDVRTVTGQLPAQGLHHNNSMALGTDGYLYFTMGSSTNNGPESNPLNGTILKVAPSGGVPEIFASGLRNPFDLGFDASGALFATDNGCDPPVCVDAPEEFNYVVAGGRYGFPEYVGTPPDGSGTIGPIATFAPHSSANGLVIYQGDMFEEWNGQAFVALFGSYLEGFEDAGHRVLRLELGGSGDARVATVQRFAEGFARPLDVAVAPDGALIVADFEAGRVYRLSR